MSSASQSESRTVSFSTAIQCESSPIRIPGHGPRLLVSVRSVVEAQRAIDGGVDILDVKEPLRGSLGMAGLDQIGQIAHLRKVASGIIPLSVALGEVADWFHTSDFPVLPRGITFAKLGLSHCGRLAEWRANWLQIRTEFERRSLSQLNWVAVAYADSIEAGSPRVEEVVEAAIETRCAGLLIDTWTKTGMTLLDKMDVTPLTAIADACHAAGLFLALAGKVQRDSLPKLVRVPADIVAIRSAACLGTDRTSDLDSGCVTDFRHEMRRWFE